MLNVWRPVILSLDASCRQDGHLPTARGARYDRRRAQWLVEGVEWNGAVGNGDRTNILYITLITYRTALAAGLENKL